MMVDTKTFVKKMQGKKILLIDPEYDIQNCKWVAEKINVENVSQMLLNVEFDESMLKDNMEEVGGNVPDIHRILIETLPDRDFLSLSGENLKVKTVMTVSEFNQLLFIPTGIGYGYTEFRVRVMTDEALTDVWSESLRIIIDIIGVL